MKKIILIFIIFLSIFNACTKKPDKITIVTTINPVAQIIKELVGDSIEVVCLVPPGQSPHTFSISPSDQRKLEEACAIFYVSDELDGWATKTENKNKFSLLNMLPDSLVLYFENEEHQHNGSEAEHKEQTHTHSENKKARDPHFWTDPLAVKSILNDLLITLVDVLSKCNYDDPHLSAIADRVYRFATNLDTLDFNYKINFIKYKDKPVFLFHPSFRYFFKRYGLKYMGAIELSPGKEPTPSYITEIINKIKASGAKAIFTEPQLNDKTAKMIAVSAGVQLFMLDPIGGVEGRMNYFELIDYNANTLLEALK